MDEKDHVFARFQDNKPAASDRRREMLTIPRRAGAPGSRVVEVVHVKSGDGGKDRPRRDAAHVRAASWEGGFPAKRPAPVAPPEAPAPAAGAAPTAHLMPAWEPMAAEAAPPSAPGEPAPRPPRSAAGRKPAAHVPARRVADPFDAEDDGANCLRCGYAVEPSREKRGLATCQACGEGGSRPGDAA